MKRFIVPAAVLICFVFCTACGKSGSHTADVQKLRESFSAGFTMELDGISAEGMLTRFDSDIWSAYFDTPTEIAGVVLDFMDDDVSASYKGLSFSVPQAAMPSKALLLRFIDAVDELDDEDEIVYGEKKDGLTEIKGELDGEPYLLYLNEDGSPAEFRMDNMGGWITFSGFSSDVKMTTTVTTIESLVVTTTDTAVSE